jgi:cell fate (sporulation/competence/biofilm development) regulator YlbF (YheA/YmcA/DUF963 family)
VGTGKIRECDECHQIKEHAAKGLCFSCYRKVQRIVEGNQAARSEREFDKRTQHFRRAQDKMVKAVYDLRRIHQVFEEYGIISEFLEEDNKTISILADVLVLLMEKASQTVKGSSSLPDDPLKGQLHIQTVMGNDYIQRPFAGKLSQPLKEGDNNEAEDSR